MKGKIILWAISGILSSAAIIFTTIATAEAANGGGKNAVSDLYGCIQPGYFHLPETEITLILYGDGTGSFDIDGNANPFTWQCQNGSIQLVTLDTDVAEKDRKQTAVIINGDVKLNDEVFIRMRDITLKTLKYQEPGFDGALSLAIDRTNGWYLLKLNTVRKDAGAMCEYEGSCEKKGKLLMCQDPDNEDNFILVKNYDEDQVELDTTGQISSCGRGASFTGMYGN